ncbi:LysR family transcriptional regulator [Pectobacterium brasiliense]|uniref:LysR family transcriptional regulator n=1 Tax=Pectobacterium brasiliense TaxID=180957 RepID=M4GWV8_9GAMM|nr:MULTISPECIES: LysR family transcriptional regulator [Pectobacterium]GKW29421.1 transcriptional regulator [Pectobacterium carotovorum subsp. carotovorum]AFH56804.1 LysR family transcriptional regulator [Pectobacterium brasiliense]KGA36226.1 LysR family transcriptional regulator [Pectobacterium brasiliense]KMK84072.1 LysR family transcriptional regulator [Pectobacterium brasiliense ICMP 19477]MBN3048053.1 LysR family transcriptional regulator [Pectobacterium brasiliense]
MDWTNIPPLYALKAFESAAKHQSFTLAASELFISQSAISKHINTIEVFFGRKLFYRKGPKVFLTKEGESFAGDLRHAFEILSKACENVHRAGIVLTISSPYTFSIRQFIPILRKYKNKDNFPIITVETINDDYSHSIANLKNHDATVKYGDGKFSDEWNCTLLSPECLIVVVSPKLLHLFEKDNRILIDLVYVKSRELDWFSWCEESRLKDRFQVINKYEFESMDSAINAVIKGLGIAVVDIGMVYDELMDGVLLTPFKFSLYSGKGYYFLRGSDDDNDLSSLLECVKLDLSGRGLAELCFNDKCDTGNCRLVATEKITK